LAKKAGEYVSFLISLSENGVRLRQLFAHFFGMASARTRDGARADV
jgi:hypothetical protein